MRIYFPSLAYSLLIFVGSCAPYKVSTETLVKRSLERNPEASVCDEEQRLAARSGLYNIIPRHRSQIRWYDVGHWFSWMVLGNDDDGIFGEASHKQHPQKGFISTERAIRWTLRNPFHNFCHYVVGQRRNTRSEFVLLSLSRRQFTLLKPYEVSPGVFPDQDSCFHIAFHGIFPFVGLRLKLSERRQSDFYIGWREKGNFGVKCQPLKRVNKEGGQTGHADICEQMSECPV